MVIEAVVAIGAGVVARSITLLAFGIDSVIELASAGVLIWRLNVELRHGQSFAEPAEHMASRVGGVLLFALAAYVVLAAGWSLRTRQGQAFSWPGLIVSLAAIPIMWIFRAENFALPRGSAVVRYGQTQLRASPAAGFHQSSCSAFWRKFCSAHGGSIPQARLRLSGCWSRKAARHGDRNQTTIERGRINGFSPVKITRLGSAGIRDPLSMRAAC